MTKRETEIEIETDKRIGREDLPIGVFDSGFGGISVLRELVKQLPHEDFLFYGDSANAPYGEKTMEKVRKLTLEKVEYLRGKGIKAVVIACNTATSAAIKALRETYTDMPVIGIEPAVKPATMVGEHPRVLVLATPGTVKGSKFQELEERFEDKAKIIPVACPGLMDFVEAGIMGGEQVDTYLQNLLSSYLKEGVDAVVLGCTHYPFLRKAIQKAVGENVHVIDGSAGTARELKRRLKEEDLLSSRQRAGEVEFEMSLPERIPMARKLLIQKDM